MVMIVSGSLDSVPGFHTAGTSCGIKEGGKPDLGVLLCDVPCCAAGVFTTNRVQAAPVIYSKNILSRNAHAIRGIVANSGNANACTGERGLRDAAAVAAEAERIFSLPEGSLLVMSTGVIGKPLPVEKLKAGLGRVQEQFITGSSGSFASAIMTTDTKEKSLALKFEIEGVPIKLGAAAKGAGMIHPDMATMLAFFTTDAALTPDALSVVLRQVTGRTFNRLSVDGDRSPNDSVIMLASGTGGAPLIQGPESRGFSAFYSAVLEAGSSLARMIAADGEGATKLVEIRVKGADTFDSANRVARAIANSPLVKTALYGADPNWGRIICAAGYSGAPVEPDKIDIYFGSLLAVKSGVDAGSDRLKLAGELKKNEITVTVDLNQGPHECSFWTCDFSYDYIRINADYHT